MPDTAVADAPRRPGIRAMDAAAVVQCCKYCGTPVTDAAACVNCGALIAPQHLGAEFVLEEPPVAPPGPWRVACLVVVGLLALSIQGYALAFLLRTPWPKFP